MAAAKMQRVSAGRISMAKQPARQPQSGDGFLDVGAMQENMLKRQKAESLALRERITAQFGFLNSGLQELKLRGNTIGDRGVVMLAAVLEQVINPSTLSL